MKISHPCSLFNTFILRKDELNERRKQDARKQGGSKEEARKETGREGMDN